MSEQSQQRNQDQITVRKTEDLEPKRDAKGGGRAGLKGYQTGGSAGGGLPGQPEPNNVSGLDPGNGR